MSMSWRGRPKARQPLGLIPTAEASCLADRARHERRNFNYTVILVMTRPLSSCPLINLPESTIFFGPIPRYHGPFAGAFVRFASKQRQNAAFQPQFAESRSQIYHSPHLIILDAFGACEARENSSILLQSLFSHHLSTMAVR